MERKKWLLLASFCFISSLFLFFPGGTYYWNGYSSPVLPIPCESYKGTCAFGCSLNVILFPLPLFFPSDTVDLVCLSSIMTLCDNFTTISCVLLDSNFGRRSNELHKKSFKLKCLIALLLLMSGNVQPNPGPDTPIGFNTPADFKERSGLGFFHLNVRSLVPKMDMLRIWAHSTDTDVIVLSETWLSK